MDTNGGVIDSLGVMGLKAMAESEGWWNEAESYGWGIGAEELWDTWVLDICVR